MKITDPLTAEAVSPEVTDILIVGSGFAGITMATQLRRSGRRSFLILERADDVGGTWRDNNYPGAQVDVASPLYSLSFGAGFDWSRLNAYQPEIWQHQKTVFANEGLTEHFRPSTEVLRAEWDDHANRWTVETTRGTFVARVLITAAGHLSDPKMPDLPGLDRFEGEIFHSAQWRHEFSVDGKRVGVIGTGASAVQVVPAIADVTEHLIVFQRSAAWCAPKRDREFTLAERRMFQRMPETFQALRAELYWTLESSVPQRHMVEGALDRIRTIAQEHLAAQVADPELRRKLTPDYEIGCKRILRTDDYYPALCRPDVTLETAPIVEVTSTGIRTPERLHALDVLVMCTGFEATDLPIAHRIVGRQDVSLHEYWDRGERAFATTSMHGFPNLFFMNGPNAGLGVGSVVDVIETQASYIRGAIDWMEARHAETIEVDAKAEDDYVAGIEARMNGTVWLAGGCSSWYVDPRSGKVTTLWPDFVSRFRMENGTFDPAAYHFRARQDA
ncbi:flavin-containing monooxygenase [Dactylosporangium sp. CA-092794]|uniref:flavin-containing monooxygenase n=1 Tax=Dactylosporangium sp. CA-092794 TaxID=3239929 RepID=UPI003D8E44D5